MARDVANVWWAMFGFSVVVLVVVSALWIYAMLRQPRTHSAEEAKRINRRWIIGGGLVLPTVSIVALLAFGIPTGRSMLPLPVEGEQPLRVQVIGHQWWWEVVYPYARGGALYSANEILVPVGTPVEFEIGSIRSGCRDWAANWTWCPGGPTPCVCRPPRLASSAGSVRNSAAASTRT
jgi:cytochrome c oxidase subunit II